MYHATTAFPRDELYGLTSQIRRASSSIPANIAEGCGRSSNAELARFLEIASGSASELDYHLLLAKDLDLLTAEEHESMVDELAQIRKMLNAFIQKLRATA